MIAAAAGLVGPSAVRELVVLAAWLVWPPALMVAWALARERVEAALVPGGDREAAQQARHAAAALIGAVAVASVVYRALVANRLDPTAALFIGISTLVAIVVVFAVSPRTAAGVACKAVTVGLLASLVFLGEGILQSRSSWSMRPAANRVACETKRSRRGHRPAAFRL